MAKYKAPGIAVHQTIQQTALTYLPEQNVALVGPFASLKLYNASPAERTRSYVGQYASGDEVRFDWDRAVGDIDVDFDFTKVYLRNALLKYGTAGVVVKANKYNQITVTGSATDFISPTRAIQAGDVVRLTVGGKEVISAVHSVDNVTLDSAVTEVPMTDADGNPVPDILVSGSYGGNNDVTYIVDVVKGGDVLGPDFPVVRVRTATGEDTTEDITLNKIPGDAYKLGTRGLTFAVADPPDSTALVQGDSLYYTTSAVAVSDTNLLTLRQNLPLQTTDTPVSSVDFFVARDITLSTVYFTQTSEHLKISGDIKTTDYEFGDSLLDVAQGDVYAPKVPTISIDARPAGFTSRLISTSRLCRSVLPSRHWPQWLTARTTKGMPCSRWCFSPQTIL